MVTNPFFSLFRGLIPPIGGLDLSPLPAFFLLSFLTNATQSLGAELPSKDGSKRPANGGAFFCFVLCIHIYKYMERRRLLPPPLCALNVRLNHHFCT